MVIFLSLNLGVLKEFLPLEWQAIVFEAIASVGYTGFWDSDPFLYYSILPKNYNNLTKYLMYIIYLNTIFLIISIETHYLITVVSLKFWNASYEVAILEGRHNMYCVGISWAKSLVLS